jgi:adenylyltransferase/sulfurtransferase
MHQPGTVREIEPLEVARLRDEGRPFQLIDIREGYEVELCSIGGTHIPMGEVTQRLAELRRDVPVVVHCRSGARSAALVAALSARYGFDNLYSLRGGIMAWGREVDPGIQCD